MRRLLGVFSVLAVAIGLFFTAVPDGYADALDRYRADGAIAERFDGYVETRRGAPAGAASLVRDVNNKRRAIYEKRAREQNVPASAVGALFAEKIMRQAPGGTYFRRQDGSYVRK